MRKIWHESAWSDYLYWQMQDKKTLKRINALIQDIERNGNNGIRRGELNPICPFLVKIASFRFVAFERRQPIGKLRTKNPSIFPKEKVAEF